MTNESEIQEAQELLEGLMGGDLWLATLPEEREDFRRVYDLISEATE